MDPTLALQGWGSGSRLGSSFRKLTYGQPHRWVERKANATGVVVGDSGALLHS